MNYENQRQKNRHVSENCTGVAISNAHKTGNNEPLRLNYAHMKENNAHTRETSAHILKVITIFTHLAPLGAWVGNKI